jgi:hypothetical protein
MTEARYDAVADFYITGFDAIADPASLALLDLLGPPLTCVSSTSPAGTAASPGPWPAGEPT